MKYDVLHKLLEIQYLKGRLDELYKGYVPHSLGHDERVVDSRISKYEDKLNIRNLLSNGEKLSDKPRVFLSTIHSIKGGEEENVIVALDLAHKIRKALQRSQAKRDEEHRVFYVAYTRAAQNLYLLKSKIERKGYQV